MSRLVVGPFNRVEGDLEVTLEHADGVVRAAYVNAPMYRGFEQMLRGKPARDALVLVPRICGICSVSQSVAAARALADLAGVQPAANGLHCSNLMLATENLADHLTHFYAFFMPDFCRPAYAQRPWFEAARTRFLPGNGAQTRQALAARQRAFTLLGTLAGKWPHTQSIEPGGSARALDAAERLQLLAKVREWRAFVEQALLADRLEALAELDSADALLRWHAQQPMQGDLRFFLSLALDTGLDALGPGPGRCLSYGSYPQADGTLTWRSGVWHADGTPGGSVQALDTQHISEDAQRSWLASGSAALHPWSGLTLPEADKPDAYSWNKAPRLDGQVLECGALARQLVAGQPLIRSAVAHWGCGVLTRVLARALELALVLPLMEAWLRDITPGAPFCQPAELPEHGQGVGLTEAARGSLGHWLVLRQGRIENYQIIAPTSWNFSPRDRQGVPGALEQALVGAPLRAGEETPVAAQHIVRSFDPCMVCTVH